MKATIKKYLQDFTLGMVVYGVLLFGSNYYLNNYYTSITLQVILALLPMCGAFLALKAVLAFIRSQDELQRKNIMDAVLISFTMTALGTFAYGFLEGVGFPKMDTHWVFVLLIGGMGLAEFYTCWWRHR